MWYFGYEIIMVNRLAGKGSTIMKTICAAMIIVVGASLFTPALGAPYCCSINCHCLNDLPMDTKIPLPDGMQMPVSISHCSESKHPPCGLVPLDASQWADVTPVLNYRADSFGNGVTIHPVHNTDDAYHHRDRTSLYAEKIACLHPLYLQKMSFII